MSANKFPHYTTDYISGVLSLRNPQEDSLKILEEIVNNVKLDKRVQLSEKLSTINNLFPICTDFEREFMSITFALATGVGKTRLMGAFIAYLYTQHNIRNFFVVAPGTTVYQKLKKDLGDPSNPKYVFKGLGCFSSSPQIITDIDYTDRQLALEKSDINIFIFNIDKFNRDDTRMKAVNEFLGTSFYKKLASFDDLVLIMDESHHYHAAEGTKALNNLNPVLGLELTATPLVKKGAKQEPFKNVVFEYPLSKAIKDGYTRTPFAVTRTDIEFYNFGEQEIDKMMLVDGVICHEKAKDNLEAYSVNNGVRLVKPFMLVVCKNTEHAQWVDSFIKSDEFQDGKYKNKVITVHSKKTGTETEANTKLLLDVENYDNPIEIVIHVNMLKEGWDVNNLYTIVPLRTATSKILREQMVGRGLRLPYGERTGDKEVDAVMLTAHDKFDDILNEAQKGDSIFKAGNIIQVEDIEKEKFEYTQIALSLDEESELRASYDATDLPKTEKNDDLLNKINATVQNKATNFIQENKSATKAKSQSKLLAKKIIEEIANDKDLGEIFRENEMPLTAWMCEKTEEVLREASEKYIPIPQIRVVDAGEDEYAFDDFDIDLTDFNHVPTKNDLVIQSLEDPADRQYIKGNSIDFDGYNPQRSILGFLREKPEINYEKCSELLFKLINQVCEHYEDKYSINSMKNIIMMYKKDISEKIYNQMMKHFYYDNTLIKEEIISTRDYNLVQNYNYKKNYNLWDSYSGEIRSILFEGIKKGVFTTAKFDSYQELLTARIMESDPDVKNWLRPAKREFNIAYNRGKLYEPDFVAETDDYIYLIEIKGEDRIDDPDVTAKSKRAVTYCQLTSNWSVANGYKEWRYLFIPHTAVLANSSFKTLAKQFVKT